MKTRIEAVRDDIINLEITDVALHKKLEFIYLTPEFIYLTPTTLEISYDL